MCFSCDALSFLIACIAVHVVMECPSHGLLCQWLNQIWKHRPPLHASVCDTIWSLCHRRIKFSSIHLQQPRLGAVFVFRIVSFALFFITFTGTTMSGKLSVFGFLQGSLVKCFCFSCQGCGPPLPCHGAIVLQLCSPYKLYGVLVFAGCGRERACIGPDPIRVVPICRFAPAGRFQLQFCIIGIPYFVKVVVARSQRLRVQFPSRRWTRGTSPPQGRVDFCFAGSSRN